MEEQPLVGGVANAGDVVRVGAEVLRPSNPHSQVVHRFLRALREAGFSGASLPVAIDSDGRERLVFIEGDVPVPPYPAWAQDDPTLASTASLLARFHTASATFDPMGQTWSVEMADPVGGPIVCHNDVCLENVVFVDGVAVGLLDFDFCARVARSTTWPSSLGCAFPSMMTSTPPGWLVRGRPSGSAPPGRRHLPAGRG